MKTIVLKGTDLTVSRFIFGTAALFNIRRAVERQNLLEAVVDAGFTHFDTAPYYGFGIAECALAPVLRAHPQLTVTTKVGIYSAGGESQSSTSVFLRKAFGRVIRPLSRPTIDFSLKKAKEALEGSLRRLGRETIDLYMLHEPEPELVATEEWQRWLECCVTDGKLRAFGLALAAERVEPFLATGRTLGQVIQMTDSLSGREADVLQEYGRPMQITYGYVSAAMSNRDPMPVREILRRALLRNISGAVIVSTKRRDRLAQYSEVAAEVGSAE